MSISNEMVLQELKNVIDPELNINIVDLGLVYDVSVQEDKVVVEMTLTTPGCPMRSYMEESVYTALINMDGVEEVIVNVVWSPPWSPEKINPETLEQLQNR